MMSALLGTCRQRLRAAHNFALYTVLVALSFGCSNEPRRPPSTGAPARSPREAVVEEPKAIEATGPLRVRLEAVRGAELYIPAWFSAKRGGYDLIVHFHGVGKIQERNIERAQLNVAVVSINLGMGTDPYAKPFARREVFESLLADAQEAIANSGRAPNAKLRRLALSAWSAGYVSVAKVMNDPSVADKVDAVLLADGFFTSFTDVKKRTVNEDGVKLMARLAEAASRDEKLFAITHTTIPTGPFPSTQECVAKLLEMTSLSKTPSAGVGPRDMHQIYLVDRGSFHVKGYEGQTAGDHVKQIHAMGETLYPYLKSRWDKQDAEQQRASGSPPPPPPSAAPAAPSAAAASPSAAASPEPAAAAEAPPAASQATAPAAKTPKPRTKRRPKARPGRRP